MSSGIFGESHQLLLAQNRALTGRLSSIRALRANHTLSTLLQRAQPLRTRIEEWRQRLPLLTKPVSELTEEEFEVGAALRLSHLTVEILIFRSLLRPLRPSLAHGDFQGPVATIFKNCYTCSKVGTDIVSALNTKHFASYWPPCKSNAKIIGPLLGYARVHPLAAGIQNMCFQLKLLYS